MTDESTDIRVGDWVRFYTLEELTIAEVRYILPHSSINARALLTDKGPVTADRVLEVRRGSGEASEPEGQP